MRSVSSVCVVLAATGVAWAGTSATGSDSVKPDDLRLRVSTHHGYVPLDLQLTGKIANIETASFKSCVVRVDRTYEGPSSISLTERKEYPCLASREGEVPAAFDRELTLTEPGDYSLRIVLEPVEGRPIAGMTREVRVFRSKIEAGISTQDN